MSKNILVVVGSIRKVRVADSVLDQVKQQLSAHEDVTTTVADLRELSLPMFNNERMPADPEFAEADERVQQWTKLVGEADGVLFLTPEYNHSLTAAQKNAIDWIYSEWADKPVSSVFYGWSGGSFSMEDLNEVIGNVKAKLLPTPARLWFMKQINPDGSVIDETAVSESIKATVDELVSA